MTDKEVIRFRPESIARQYGYNIFFEKGGKTNRIQAKAIIQYAGEFIEDKSIFHLSRQEVCINKEEPDEHSHRLADACSKAFYPLCILCNKEGRIENIRGDLVQAQWEEIKPAILREFDGECPGRYIAATEESIRNPQNLRKLISQDLFFHTYFSLQYPLTSEKNEVCRQFPLLPFSTPLQTKGYQEVVTQENGLKYICWEGLVTDERYVNYRSVSGQESEEESGKITGEARLVYKLDKHELIDSLTLEAVLKKEDGTPLSKIKMQAFHLRENPLLMIEDTDTIRLGQQIEKAVKKAEGKRKGIWKRFVDYLNEPL